MMARIAALAVAAVLLVACDDGSEEKDGPPTETPDLRGECDLSDRVGRFYVQHEIDYSAVSGEVHDGVVPITIMEEVLEADGCRLMRRNNTVCDPACEAGQTCDFDGTCIPYPATLGVGEVVILGLNKEVVMEEGTYFDTTMPHPGFDPGAHVRLEAEGGDYSPFELYGRGVTPLQIPDETWVLRQDQPLEVSWEEAQDEQAHMLLTFNIDQHGNTPVTMFCTAEDTGSLTVPASLVNEFKSQGVSGFSAANLFRITSDSVEIEPGCVQFDIFSHRAGDLQVEGHVPCTGEGDCPDGMTCDIPTQTCI